MSEILWSSDDWLLLLIGARQIQTEHDLGLNPAIIAAQEVVLPPHKRRFPPDLSAMLKKNGARAVKYQTLVEGMSEKARLAYLAKHAYKDPETAATAPAPAKQAPTTAPTAQPATLPKNGLDKAKNGRRLWTDVQRKLVLRRAHHLLNSPEFRDVGISPLLCAAQDIELPPDMRMVKTSFQNKPADVWRRMIAEASYAEPAGYPFDPKRTAYVPPVPHKAPAPPRETLHLPAAPAKIATPTASEVFGPAPTPSPAPIVAPAPIQAPAAGNPSQVFVAQVMASLEQLLVSQQQAQAQLVESRVMSQLAPMLDASMARMRGDSEDAIRRIMRAVLIEELGGPSPTPTPPPSPPPAEPPAPAPAPYAAAPAPASFASTGARAEAPALEAPRPLRVVKHNPEPAAPEAPKAPPIRIDVAGLDGAQQLLLEKRLPEGVEVRFFDQAHCGHRTFRENVLLNVRMSHGQLLSTAKAQRCNVVKFTGSVEAALGQIGLLIQQTEENQRLRDRHQKWSNGR